MEGFFRGAGRLVSQVAKDVGSAAKGAIEATTEALDAAQSMERPADFGRSFGSSNSRSAPVAADAEGPESLRILTGSWNLMGQVPSAHDDLSEWLLAGCGPSEAPDVVALGVQELVHLHPANCVSKAGGDWDKEDEFDQRVLQSLAVRGNYVKVRSVGMIGLYLACFVRDTVEDHVHSVDADRIRTSTEGVLAGKKGAVAIRFSVRGSSFSFVNVHLPSGQERTQERSTALRQIVGEAYQGVNLVGGDRPQKLGFKRGTAYSMTDHSGSFIFGDFNFRLNISFAELPKSISELTPEECCTVLRAFDPSLSGEVDPALVRFTEGNVTFPPTYKFKVGTDLFDESRLPAWTDRVFSNGRDITQLHYRAHHGLRNSSDHRPVSALFRAKLTPVAVTAATARE
mmetsp:Transcript_112057/g.297822  ORF Transcript_112057/g.297822 Transcript_112057/m.297822 type:complete len:399 (-) Transcript_112057:129-1325(-)